MRAALPETYSWASTTAVQTTRVNTSTGALANPYCRVVEPFLTSFRGLATYIVPEDRRAGERHLAQRSRAPSCEANYVVTSAIAQPSLGRDLSSGNVTVNLVEPGTLYGARQQQHRHADRQDPPLRPDPRAGRRGRLQPAEHRRRHGYNNGYTAPAAGRGSIG